MASHQSNPNHSNRSDHPSLNGPRHSAAPRCPFLSDLRTPAGKNQIEALREIIKWLKYAGHKEQIQSVEMGVKAAAHLIRTHHDAGVVEQLCKSIGSNLPTSKGVEALFNLLRDPSNAPITSGSRFRHIQDDYRAYYAASALVEMSQPPSTWGEFANTRIENEEATAIRKELKALCRDRHRPPQIKRAIKDALAFDTERTRYGIIVDYCGFRVGELYARYCEHKRYWTGRERQPQRDFVNSDKCEYRTVWVSAWGDRKYDHPEQILIDPPRGSGLSEVNKQRGRFK